jgi:hypothetical protein
MASVQNVSLEFGSFPSQDFSTRPAQIKVGFKAEFVSEEIGKVFKVKIDYMRIGTVSQITLGYI